jgi:hypothetical protein
MDCNSIKITPKVAKPTPGINEYHVIIAVSKTGIPIHYNSQSKENKETAKINFTARAKLITDEYTVLSHLHSVTKIES